MNSVASSSNGSASGSCSASKDSASATSQNDEKRKVRHKYINAEGIRILDKWIQENLHTGQLYDVHERKAIVEAVKAVGNSHYKLNNLSSFLLRRNISTPRVTKVSKTEFTAEEEILFPTISKEILSAIKWLHSMDRTNISGYIIDLTLHQKELFAYVQYLDETNKATNSAERKVPAFERLLPSISAENKNKIHTLYRLRPDASSDIAQFWGKQIGVNPLDAVLYVHCLRAHARKRKNTGSISIPDSNALIGSAHLPTPSLSASPEPLSPSLFKCSPNDKGLILPSAASPYESNRGDSISFLPSPELTPAHRAAVIPQRSPSPLVDGYCMPIKSTNIGVSSSVAMVSQSPGTNGPPIVGRQDLDLDLSLEKRESRAHSIPPITRLVTDTTSSSRINSRATSPSPAISLTTSRSTDIMEEDQLANDHDNDIDMSATDFYAGSHFPTPNLTTTLAVETLPTPSSTVVVDREAHNSWNPHIHKISASLHPTPFFKLSSPTTAQELLDNITLYEGALDDILAMVDYAASESIG